VMHELGHVLGYGDDDGQALMNGALPLGERRLPTAAAEPALKSSDAALLERLFTDSDDDDRAWSWL